tara:strand:+ start:277 stop:900 length:624 start_codon:yes stop_codon:yes gene_type:complete
MRKQPEPYIKVCIATSRDIGKQCQEWAMRNIPSQFELVKDIESADIVISVLYDKILGPDIVNNKECFNFHPGILPEYRGAGAYSWTLINEDRKSGITLHLIDAGIDTGDIIEIREFIVTDLDTAFSLNERGNALIYKMFKDWFKDLLAKKYIAVPQPEEKARTYYRNDLNKIKDLTKYVKALHFPTKESAYYINNLGVKNYIKFIEG